MDLEFDPQCSSKSSRRGHNAGAAVFELRCGSSDDSAMGVEGAGGTDVVMIGGSAGIGTGVSE